MLLGAVLLSLPVASNDGSSTSFLDALFTSVSATCVTGLVVFDTFTHWSVFGRIVIAVMIQIGGLGFMSIATLFSVMVHRRARLRAKMVAMQSLNLYDMSDVRTILKHIFIGTAAFEGAAAFVFTVRFMREYGFLSALGRGIFLSVSAFCNAGFDLCGDKTPSGSLTQYSGDLVVNITVMLLIVIGGLGFLVWEDIYTKKRFSRCSLFSKIVIISSLILIFGGALFIFAAEYDNSATLGAMPLQEKILAALFQSVSPRTAGFNTVDLSQMRDVTKIFCVFLMLIGGSSGSTAGGIKVPTVAVLFISVISVLRGRRQVVFKGRRIADETVFKAFALTVSVFVIAMVSAFAVCFIDGIAFTDALFECVSAICTVGLSIAGTASLSTMSHIILMCLMFLGRVGLLTASFAIFNRPSDASDSIGYPEGKILIG